MLVLFGSVVATFLTFAISILLDKNMRYPACYLMIGSCVLGFIFSFFVRERLRRSRAGLASRSFSFHVGNVAAAPEEEEVEQSPSNSKK